MGVVRVGTCAWADREVLASGWYPPSVRTPAQRLAHYASRFPVVEVDSTYHAPPRRDLVERWARWTPDGFVFHVKAYSLLTGHPTRVAAMDADLRPASARPLVRAGDVEPDVVEEVWRRFLAALQPMADAGRLGAVLLQLPPWAAAGPAALDRVADLVERCRPHRACVEVRNPTWLAPGARERLLALLRDVGAAWVCLDAPWTDAAPEPPPVAATADLAVVRLHGRSAHWDSGDRFLRYAYRYSTDELRAWVPRVLALADVADVHVLVNTCGGDAPQAAAAELTGLLAAAGAPVVPPPGSPPGRSPSPSSSADRPSNGAPHNGGDALFPA